MVYYFQVNLVSEYDDFGINSSGYTVYMGKDKFENDPLIKHSNPKNLWFHVDNYSSAHLYLQLKEDEQLVKFEELKLDEELLKQIGQLTKANSIKANKLNNITIIYTPVANLHTDGTMDVGTVTFKDPKKVKKIHIAKKDNSIINKLNKTKHEISTDECIKKQQEMVRKYTAEKKQRERLLSSSQKQQQKVREEQKQKSLDPYADLFTEDNLHTSSNEFRNENWVEDEFW